MNRFRNAFKIIVLISGILNFPIGLMVLLGSFNNPQPQTFNQIFVLGLFLMFAGTSLIWASQDIKNRASIILWNGLVRLGGFMIMIYASKLFEVGKEQVVISYMDLSLFFIFVIGSIKFSNSTLPKILLGKVNKGD